MADTANTFSDPNAIRLIIAINAFHYVLGSLDPNLAIETQSEVIEKMPEGRLYEVCPIDSLSEFQQSFIIDQYKTAIKGKLFAAFPTYEDKMAHALSAQAIATIPDAASIDFDKQYNNIKGAYRTKIIEYFFNKSMVNLTITPQDTAINSILLRNSIKQYCADINNAARTVAIISGAVEKFLPNIIELRKNGLSFMLYESLLSEIRFLFITYSLSRVMYKPNTPGLSDSSSISVLKEAIEKLKNIPELPENYIYSIEMMMDTSESVSNKNSNTGCLGILVLLLMLVPTLTYAATKLIF